MNEMPTAWGYVRLSQTGRTGTLEEQKRSIREYADQNGFDLETTKNDGSETSGFNADRQGYRIVKQQIRDGGIDAIIIRDRARLSREFDERLRLLTLFRSSTTDWHVIEAGGKLDIDDLLPAAMEAMHAAMDHHKKMVEIERAREVVQDRVEDPEIDHGRARFGMQYSADGTRQVPGDDFGIVKQIWSLRNEGMSYAAIADETGVPQSTVYRVVQDREWYEERY